jgi:hypothetical protein
VNCWTEEPGIEVKAAETVRAEDFGDHLAALPVSALWTTAS